jgi:hypothetical protein
MMYVCLESFASETPSRLGAQEPQEQPALCHIVRWWFLMWRRLWYGRWMPSDDSFPGRATCL